MPHLGRQYPFLPEYWAGNTWFWPHFLPWKYYCDFHPALSGPWSDLPDKIAMISAPGILLPDGKTARWTWDFDDSGFHYHLQTDALGDMAETDHELRWLTSLFIDGIGWAESTATVKFSVQSPSPGGYTEGFDPGTGLPCDPAVIYTREATYAEGGSPFPHPTGGGP